MKKKVRVDLIFDAMARLASALRESGVGGGGARVKFPKPVMEALRVYLASLSRTNNEMRDYTTFSLYGIWVEEDSAP